MTRRILGLIGAVAAAALLLPATPTLADPPPHARAWGHRDFDDHDGRHYDDRDDHRHHDCDHGRYFYPRPAYYVPRLPRGYRVVYYGGLPHYYYRDVWYAPYGGRYGVITPPAALVIDGRGVRGYVSAEIPIVRW
jgi:hypothetical protein